MASSSEFINEIGNATAIPRSLSSKIEVNKTKWNDYRDYQKFCVRQLDESRHDHERKKSRKKIFAMLAVLLLVSGLAFCALNGLTGLSVSEPSISDEPVPEVSEPVSEIVSEPISEPASPIIENPNPQVPEVLEPAPISEDNQTLEVPMFEEQNLTEFLAPAIEDENFTQEPLKIKEGRVKAEDYGKKIKSGIEDEITKSGYANVIVTLEEPSEEESRTIENGVNGKSDEKTGIFSLLGAENDGNSAKRKPVGDFKAELRMKTNSIENENAMLEAFQVMESGTSFTAEELNIWSQNGELTYEEENKQKEKNIAIREKKTKLQQGKVLKDLKIGSMDEGSEFDLKTQFILTNGFAGKVNEKGLKKLESDPRVKSVELDGSFELSLAESMPWINAPGAWETTMNGQKVNGTGQAVCVIDTGIDYSQTALSSRLISGAHACYCYNGTAGCCSGGASKSSNGDDDVGHGTAMAGAIASVDATYKGVAQGAKLVSMKVQSSTGAGSWSDIALAIDNCVYNSTKYNISVIVLGLGDGSSQNSEAYCDSYTPYSSVQNAITNKIMVVGAAGQNSAYTAEYGNSQYGNDSGIQFPACMSIVTSVSATFKSGSNPPQRSLYAHTGTPLDLFAPGGDLKDLNYLRLCNPPSYDPYYYYTGTYSGVALQWYTSYNYPRDGPHLYWQSGDKCFTNHPMGWACMPGYGPSTYWPSLWSGQTISDPGPCENTHAYEIDDLITTTKDGGGTNTATGTSMAAGHVAGAAALAYQVEKLKNNRVPTPQQVEGYMENSGATVKNYLTGGTFSQKQIDVTGMISQIQSAGTPPIVTINEGPIRKTYFNQTSFRIDVNATDDTGVQAIWIFNGSTNITYTGAANFTFGKDGLNTLIVYANDTNGTIGTAGVRFVIAKEKPVITITSPASTEYSQASVNLNWTSTRPLSSCEFSVNGIKNSSLCDVLWRGLKNTTGPDKVFAWPDDANGKRHLSIAVDSRGYPHIAFEGSSGGATVLRYSRWTGTDWTTEIADGSSYCGQNPSLALDAFDNPHIAYDYWWDGFGDYQLKYATKNRSSGAWITEVADATYDVGWYPPHIAVDSKGNPFIAYTDWDYGRLLAIKKQGSEWQKMVLDDTYSYRPGSVPVPISAVAFDSKDNPHIGYEDFTYRFLNEYWWNGSQTHKKVVDDWYAGESVDIAIDSNDNPHFVSIDTFLDGGHRLLYANKTTGKQIIDVTGYSMTSPSIATDYLGNPHVAYVTNTSGISYIKYAKWNGTGWAISTVASSINLTVQVAIAIDSNNRPHIAYGNSDSPNVTYVIGYPIYRNSTITLDQSGTNNVTLYGWDFSNQSASASVYPVQNLDMPPRIDILSPANTSYTSTSISFNVSLNEAGSWCGMSLDGATNKTMTLADSTHFGAINSTMTQGSHNVVFSCNDTSGNRNSIRQYFVVDTVFPASINSLGVYYRGNVGIYWNWTNPSDSDFDSAIIFFKGVNVFNTTGTLNRFLGEHLDCGTPYSITIYTKDRAGNVNDTPVVNMSSTKDCNTSNAILFSSPTPAHNSIISERVIPAFLSPIANDSFSNCTYLLYNGNMELIDSSRYSPEETRISGGYYHKCFLLLNGNVDCWGDISFNQAINYTLGDAVAITTGDYHSCALTKNRSVICWGSNSDGQSYDYGGGDAIGVSAGERHTCALLSNGNVTCWGKSQYNQTAEYGWENAIGIASGLQHNCALLSNGNVYCWGRNDYNQSLSYNNGDAIGVSAGGHHSCVLLNNGNITCWGRNIDNESLNYTKGNAITVSAGAQHTCALLNNGNVSCWGRNAYGESNNYTLGDAIGVTAGGYHNTVLLKNGSAYSWGYTGYHLSDRYVRTDLKKQPLYVFQNLDDGEYYLQASLSNSTRTSPSSQERKVTISNEDTTPPSAVYQLNMTSKGVDWLTWDWLNPIDDDFSYAMIIFDGVNVANFTSESMYNATGLQKGFHNLTIYTVDTTGNVNYAGGEDTYYLGTPQITYLQSESGLTTVNWSWQNPGDSDFNETIVFFNNVNVVNLTSDVNYYNKTELSCGTTYNLTVWTKDVYGWVNDTGVTISPKTADCIVPRLNFTYPTPNNGSSINATSATVNISITGTLLDTFKLNWNGTNYTFYDSSLVLAMNFNNETAIGDNGTYVVDVSPYSNNGTIRNGTYVNGKFGNAIMLNGSNSSFIQIPDSAVHKFTNNSNFSITGWVNASGIDPIGEPIITKWGNGPSQIGYTVRIDPGTGSNKLQFYMDRYGGSEKAGANSTTIISPNTWYHFVATYSSNRTMRLYVNGVLEGTSQFPTVIFDTYASSDPLYIGKGDMYYANGFLNGSVDEIRIYNRTLSPDEAKYQYQSELAKYDSAEWAFYDNITGLSNGKYSYYAWANDTGGNSNSTETRTLDINYTAPPDTTIPAKVTNLQSVSGSTTVNWTWTNPGDSDFNATIIFLDGTNVVNLTTPINYYNATGLICNTTYNLTVWTKDNTGNVNNTAVTNITSTFTCAPQIYLNFTYPTPVNGATITVNSAAINVTIDEDSLSSFKFNWNGTNCSFYDSSYSPLVFAMNFNNNSAIGENDTKVVDISKYYNNGTVNGAVWNSSGKYGGAFQFDGINDYIEVPDASQLQFFSTSPYSIEGWINRNGVGDIINKWSSPSKTGYGVSVDSNGKISFARDVYGGTRDVATGSTVLSQNRWYHFAATYDGNMMRVYVNGAYDGNTTSITSGSSSSVPLYIGKAVTGFGYFNGSIDEIRAYYQVLSADEIKYHYQSEFAKYNSTRWTFYEVVSNISDGDYTYSAWANNTGGGSNSTEMRILTVQYMDITLPVLTIVSPANITYNVKTTQFNVSLDEAGSWCGFSLDGNANITMTNFSSTYFNYTNSTMSDGGHSVVFSCNDTTGNMNSTAVRYFGVGVPPAKITNLQSVSGQTTINWTWTNPGDSDFNSTIIFLNGTNVVNLTSPTNYYNKTGLVCGTIYNLTVWTKDNTGNVNDTAVTNITKTNDCPLDLEAPQISVVYPENKNYTENISVLNFTVSGANNCWYSINLGLTNVTTTCGIDSPKLGDTWTARDSARSWQSLDMSADGKYQTVTYPNNAIYVSSDYGATWTAKGGTSSWYAVAVSEEGRNQTAVSSSAGGQIYVSYDYGNTWTSKGSTLNYNGIALSSDGKYQTAVTGSINGAVYISADYGSSWNFAGINGDFWGVSMSADGRNRTASMYNGNLYVSYDYGATWTAKATARAWRGIAMSSDGKYQIAGGDGLGLYTSSDYGNTWTKSSTANQTASFWYMDMSADGKVQAAGILGSGGKIWMSTDYGATWNVTASPSADWRGLAISANSTYLYLTGAEYGGYIYTSNGTSESNIVSIIGLTSLEGNNTWRVYANDSSGNLNFSSVTFNKDTLILNSITNLQSVSGQTTINWTWTNPIDSDFNSTIIFLNGNNTVNLTSPTNYYNKDGLICNTTYNLTVWTKDNLGNVNNTAVTNITKTNDCPDVTAPNSITNLQSVSGQTTINWTWTNPGDSDFSSTIIFLNGNNTVNLTSSLNYYNKTGLVCGTTYNLTVWTKDNTGNVNNTAVTNITKTNDCPISDVVAPLMNFTFPTPNNGSTITVNSTVINVTIDEANLDSFKFNWNGTNYSVYNSLIMGFNFNNNSVIGDNATKAVDISKYSNNGTIKNAAWNASGRFGGSLTFDSTDTVTNSSIINGFNGGNSEITTMSWFYAYDSTIAHPGKGLVGIGNGTLKGHFFQRISTYFDGQSAGGCIATGGPNNGLKFVISADSGSNDYWWCSNANLSGSRWYHGVTTYNSATNEVKMYIDGVLDKNFTLSQPLNMGRDIWIGTDAYNPYFNGKMDEVRIYSRVLSADEIAKTYNTEFAKYNSTRFTFYDNVTNLVNDNYNYYAWANDTSGNSNSTEMRTLTVSIAEADTTRPRLNFTYPTPNNASTITVNSTVINVTIDEPNLDSFKFNWNGTNYSVYGNSLVLAVNFNNNSAIGENPTTAVDSSKYSHNGTFSGGSGFTNSGKYGSAAKFDGTGLLTFSGYDFSEDNTYTWSFWLYDQSNTSAVRRWVTTTTEGFVSGTVMVREYNNKIHICTGGDANNCTLSGELNGNWKNAWHHFALVSDGTKGMLYEDGAGILNTSGTYTNPQSGLYLGGLYNLGDEHFNGSIDEFRIYDYALSSDEINKIYDTEFARYNSTRFTFYDNVSNLNIGNYTYSAWANDTSGLSNSTEIRSLLVGLPVPPPAILNSDSGQDEWRMYGRYLNGTGYTNSNSPDNISTTRVITVTGGTEFDGSPAVANGYAYVCDYSTTSKLYQFNASNVSKIIATRTISGGGSANMQHAPAIAGDYAYFADLTVLRQLNATNISQEISSITLVTNMYSSPIVSNGFVYVGGQGGTKNYQLNASNVSQKIAEYDAGTNFWCSATPAVANGYVYTTCSVNSATGGKVLQLNATNISIKFAELLVTGQSDHFLSSMAVARDYAYVGGNSYSSPSSYNRLYQLNASNVSQQINIFSSSHGIRIRPSVANGYVYVGNTGGVFYQLNASNVSIQVANYSTGSNLAISSPAVTDDYVYIGNYDGYVYQFNVSNVSKLITRYSLGGQAIYSSPAIANGFVYIGGRDGKFYQFGDYNPLPGMNDAPVITIISPANTTYATSTIQFNVSLNKAGSWCGMSLDGAANKTMTLADSTHFGSINSTMTQGSHNVVFSCNDTVGNMSSTAARYFGVDIIPTAKITNLQSVSGQTTINWTWTNPGDSDFNSTIVFLDGTNVANLTSPTNYYNKTGLVCGTTYNLTVWTKDNLGNVNNTGVTNITKTNDCLDTIPPQVNITSPLSNSVLTNRTIMINLTVSDTNLNYTNVSIMDSTGSIVNSTINLTAVQIDSGATAVSDYVWIGADTVAVFYKINKSSLTVTSTINGIQPRPWGITTDPDHVWTASGYVGPGTTINVQRINKSSATNTANLSTNDQNIYGLTTDKDYIWVGAYAHNTVWKVNKSSCDDGVCDINSTINLGTKVFGMQVDLDSVWIAGYSSGAVHRINKTSDAVLNISLGATTAMGLAVDSDFVWAGRTNSTDTSIVKINKSSGAIVNTIPILSGSTGQESIAVDRNYVWVSVHASYKGYMIDKSTNSIIANISLATQPSGGISVDDNYVFIPGNANNPQFYRINKSSCGGGTCSVDTKTLPNNVGPNNGDFTGYAYDMFFSQSGSSNLYTATLTVPSGGIYNITATAYDTAGNDNSSIVSNVTVSVAEAETTPSLNFTSPTPNNASTITVNSTVINVTIDEQNLDSFKFNWNGTNYSVYDSSLIFSMNFNNNSAIGENASKAVDVSKYSNNGTINGATWTIGKSGNALRFNGVNSYLDLGNNQSMKPASSITVSAWVKLHSRANYDGLFEQKTGSGYFFRLNNGAGKIQNQMYINGGWKSAYGNTVIPLDQWSFVIITYNGSAMSCYLNGVEDCTPVAASGSIQYAAGDVVEMGRSNQGSTYLNATVDEARIWNRALSADEISKRYQIEFTKYNSTRWTFYENVSNLANGAYDYYAWANDTSGLSNSTEMRTLTVSIAEADTASPSLNFTSPTPNNASTITVNSTVINVTIDEQNLDSFKFNWNGTNYSVYDSSLIFSMNFNNNSVIGENSTKAVDISKYSNNGTIYPGATYNNLGMHGSMIQLNGINGEVRVSSSSALNPKNFTVLLWVYPYQLPGTGDYAGLVDKSYGNPGYSLVLNERYLRLYVDGTGNTNLPATNKNLTANTWQHIAVSFNDNSDLAMMFIDGINFQNLTVTASPGTNSNPLVLGHLYNYVSSYFFNGTMDEVRIYNRPLSADEIRMVYQSEFTKYNSTRWTFYDNVTNLADGQYTYYAWANDTSGNSNSIEMRTVTVSIAASGTTPPYLNFTSPTPNNASTITVNSTVINVTIDEPNLDSFKFNWNGTNYSVYGSSLRLGWNFNNNSAIGETATKAVDISSNSKNATFNGNAAFTSSGKFGSAVTFDGSGDYINSTADISDDNTFTVEFWIYDTGTATTRRWVTNTVGGFGSNTVCIREGTGDIAVYLGDTTGHFNYTTGRNGNWRNAWHHYALTSNASGGRFYEDGVLILTTPLTVSSNPDANLYVGGHYSGSEYFIGSIDELRVYDYDLSADEIAKTYQSEFAKYNSTRFTFYENVTKIIDGTYRYYSWANNTAGSSNSTEMRTLTVGVAGADTTLPRLNFASPTPNNASTITVNSTEINVTIDEQNLDSFKFNWNGTNYSVYDPSLIFAMNFNNNSAIGETSTKAVDISGYSHNGTLTNGAMWNISGKFGGAVKLDGNDDYVYIANTGLNASNVTVMFWTNMKSSGDYEGFISATSEPSNDYTTGFSMDTSGGAESSFTNVNMEAQGLSGPYDYKTSNHPFGTWVHVAAVIGSGTNEVKFYVNGIQEKTNNRTAGTMQLDDIRIGARYFTSTTRNYLDGSIDDVKIYNRVLSADEIAKTYQSEFAKYNSTRFTFYDNVTNLSNGQYNYYAWANDTSGNADKTEIRILTVGASEGESTNISYCPRNLTSANMVYTLNQSITSSGTCLTVQATNVTINCQHNGITGDNTGYAIYTSGAYDYITIQNCNISNFNEGIYFESGADYGVMTNNKLDTNSRGIEFVDSLNSTVYNNLVSSNTGIGIMSVGSGNNFTNNTFDSNNYGVYLNSDSQSSIIGNTFLYNSVNLYIFASSGNTIFKNNFFGGTGVYLSASNNNLIMNNSVSGSSFYASHSAGTYLKDQPLAPYTLDHSDLTIEITNVGKFDFLNHSLAASGANFSSDIRLSSNSVFVNSTNSAGLNTSAEITLHGLNFSSPRIMVAYDDVNYAPCTSAMGCNNLSWNGSTMIFNVSHFTTYQIQDTPPAVENLSCGFLNETNKIYYLNNSVNSSGTCFTVIAENVTLDCQGFTINYSQNSSGRGIDDASDALVNGNMHNNLTVKNCNIVNGNASVDFFNGVFISANDVSIINNTITTIGSNPYVPSGIMFQGGNDSTIYGNFINGISDATGNPAGISFSQNNSYRMNVSGNVILMTNGTSISASQLYDSRIYGNNLTSYYSSAMSFTASANITVSANNITTRDTSDSGIMFRGVNDSVIYGNFINVITNAAGSSAGISFSQDSSYRMNVSGNVILMTNGTSISASQLYDGMIHGNNLTSYYANTMSLTASVNITVSANNITTRGTGAGVFLFPGATSNTLSANVIRTMSGHGIAVNAANNNFSGNDILPRGNAPGAYAGIAISGNANGNSISWNDISTIDQGVTGIRLVGVNSTIVSGNNITTYGNNGSIGITIVNNARYTNIIGNVIVTNGSRPLHNGSASGSNGIVFNGAPFNNASYNNITTRGYASSPIVAVVGSNNLFLTSNNLISYGETGGITIGVNGTYKGLLISAAGSSNCTMVNNTISAYNSTSPFHAIHLEYGSKGDSFYGTTVTAANRYYLLDDATSTGNNLTDTLIVAENGTLLFQGTQNISTITSVNGTNLNVSYNRTYLNSSQISFLNTSAVITLHGLNFSSPRIMVAYDDMDYVQCTSAMGCNNLSWNGSTMIFNASHFTTYQIQDTLKVNAPVNFTAVLAPNKQDVVLNWSVVSDADGYIVFYDNNVTKIQRLNSSDHSGTSNMTLIGSSNNSWIDKTANTTQRRFYALAAYKSSTLNFTENRTGKFDLRIHNETGGVGQTMLSVPLIDSALLNNIISGTNDWAMVYSVNDTGNEEWLYSHLETGAWQGTITALEQGKGYYFDNFNEDRNITNVGIVPTGNLTQTIRKETGDVGQTLLGVSLKSESLQSLVPNTNDWSMVYTVNDNENEGWNLAYYESGSSGWRGAINALQPGKGYYFDNFNEDQNMTYWRNPY